LSCDFVLPTLKVLPHAQVTVASTYSGWMLVFMLLPRRRAASALGVLVGHTTCPAYRPVH